LISEKRADRSPFSFNQRAASNISARLKATSGDTVLGNRGVEVRLHKQTFTQSQRPKFLLMKTQAVPGLSNLSSILSILNEQPDEGCHLSMMVVVSGFTC